MKSLVTPMMLRPIRNLPCRMPRAASNCRPSPRLRASCASRASSSSARSRQTQSPVKPIVAAKQSRVGSVLLVTVSLLGGALIYLATDSSSTPTTLNDKTFAPYRITSREVLSPTSTVLTVSPHHENPSLAYLEPLSSNWRYPLWSVEFKQPEVQIARHYTPLPPLDGENVLDGSLRFYVRAIGDGEMSNYLSRLAVGRDVWLRGPHAGFDLIPRLGARNNLVFLAGGTGVVPGLQAAGAVLDQRPDANVTILWAVRNREDLDGAQVSQPQKSWWTALRPWREEQAPLVLQKESLQSPSHIGRQMLEMKSRYGERFNVQVAVSEEQVRFGEKALVRALTSDKAVAAPSTSDGHGCQLHDQRLHERASAYEMPGDTDCKCHSATAAGKNLFIVCGPDGFVSHYAGPKVWFGGQETQGVVGGLAARLQQQIPSLARDWLVLKL